MLHGGWVYFYEMFSASLGFQFLRRCMKSSSLKIASLWTRSSPTLRLLSIGGKVCINSPNRPSGPKPLLRITLPFGQEGIFCLFKGEDNACCRWFLMRVPCQPRDWRCDLSDRVSSLLGLRLCFCGSFYHNLPKDISDGCEDGQGQ